MHVQDIARKEMLALVLGGIALATMTDTELNITGTVFAVIAVLCTVIAQILTNKKQKDLDLDPMQLL